MHNSLFDLSKEQLKILISDEVKEQMATHSIWNYISLEEKRIKKENNILNEDEINTLIIKNNEFIKKLSNLEKFDLVYKISNKDTIIRCYIKFEDTIYKRICPCEHNVYRNKYELLYYEMQHNRLNDQCKNVPPNIEEHLRDSTKIYNLPHISELSYKQLISLIDSKIIEDNDNKIYSMTKVQLCELMDFKDKDSNVDIDPFFLGILVDVI